MSLNPFSPQGLNHLLAQQPAPHRPHWPETVVAISTVIGAIVSIFGLYNSSPAASITAATITFAVMLSFSFLFIRKTYRQRKAVRVAEHAERARLSTFAGITSKALALTTEQLSPARGESSTAAYGLDQLPNYLNSKTTTEINLRREIVRAHCMVFKNLPPSATSEQCIPIARIVDDSLHRLVEELPRYLSECEKEAMRIDGWEKTHILNQAAIIRDRVNEIIAEYNALARQSKELDYHYLKHIDTSKNLRQSL
ncbi:hypothetical protein [Corallococcus sp. EGB]|uniref:hypothetical protein n=1 Tax=Corallococcus sp. EGB TaxID=1521117 RepID=UPI001CBBFCC1|nr:hypothetical protein [Corallococcus sp. EGB]